MEVNLKQLIDSKNKYLRTIQSILTKYYTKFIRDLRLDMHRTIEFQKELYDVPKWSRKKLEKEYSIFLKYSLKKNDADEEDLDKTLEDLFISQIKLLSGGSYMIEFDIPKFITFWYKCLRRVTRYFYENPKNTEETMKNKKDVLDQIVSDVLSSFVPIEDVVKYKHKTHKTKYNFDKTKSNESSELILDEVLNSSKINMDIDVNSTSNDTESLKYITSEQFENEYYNSDDNADKKNEVVEEVKHINISKNTSKKNPFRLKDDL